MTLVEFIAAAPGHMAAFEAATRASHATEPHQFPLERAEDDWFRELAAYVEFVDLEERSRRRSER
jgi:hypothetical protein